MFKSISRGIGALAMICILLAPTVSWAQQAPDRLGRAPEGWSSYFSPELQLSFAYPGHWRILLPSTQVVQEPLSGEPLPGPSASPEGYTVALIPPRADASGISVVYITAQSFEIAIDESLADWSSNLDRLWGMTSPEFANDARNRDITRNDLRSTFPSEQVLHLQLTREGRAPESQTVYITHGRLVYLINALLDAGGGEPAAQASTTLSQIASTVLFAPGAPTDLNSLWGNNHPRLTIEQNIKLLEEFGVEEPACDIVCRDAAAIREMESSSVDPQEYPPDPAFEQLERQYRERLGIPTEDRPLNEDGVDPAQLRSPDVSGRRKALPPNWLTPVRVSTQVQVLCGSRFHTDVAEFALDVPLVEGTNIRSAQGGTVVLSTWESGGYGNTIVVASIVTMADETRTYFHRYAHLKERFEVVNRLVVQGSLLGTSGYSIDPDTQQRSYHLHFHISKDTYEHGRPEPQPVDGSALVGFDSRLQYPSQYATCGYIVPVNQADILIEPIAFSQRARQGARGHYWFCYGAPYQFINECVMRSVPNLDNDSGRWSAVGPVVDPDVPRIDYRTHYLGPDNTATYRVWVCGAASSDTPWYENDSLHIGRNNTYTLDAANISGFNTGWSWSSMRMHGGYPTISLVGGVNTISVWMREDGMQFNRILLSRDHTNTPPATRCGPY
jgi:murein DD-endopeptidase MepM/ murein hydrolase activator NlpD